MAVTSTPDILPDYQGRGQLGQGGGRHGSRAYCGSTPTCGGLVGGSSEGVAGLDGAG